MKHIAAMVFVLMVGLVASAAYGDDYEKLAKGLQNSSAQVNKMEFPKLIYGLDEATAREYFTKYFDENRMTHSLSVNLGYPLERFK